MSYFKKLIKQEIRESLKKRGREDDPTVWTEDLANNIVSKFEKQYVPFVTEVEEFNTIMGKEWQNRTTPTIDKKDAEFVINFIQEELDELREAVEQENIQEILDAILDITYVGLGNGALVFGLKDKIWEAYQEVQASNLSKICTTLEEAKETVKVRSEEQGEPCHYEEVGSNYVVYRTSDKKVMKSINYFRPDLSKFFNV
jgi:NTP pyrophosphatase (non-canonical NTP hydrolase)